MYSWGVLHHTGSMWPALDNSLISLRRGGYLYIAIYNDQGWVSRYWSIVKRLYNSGAIGRVGMITAHFPWEVGGRYLVRLATGRLDLDRGMTLWHDMIDWLGGYPFECARPEQVIVHFESKGLQTIQTVRCGSRHGCNQFVFCAQD